MVTETLPEIIQELKAFDDYLRFGTDEEERPKAESSRGQYRMVVRRFLTFCNAQSPRPELAKEFIRSLEEKGVSARSINSYLWALKSYFRFKGGDRLKLRGLTVEKTLPRYLADEEWGKILVTAQRPLFDRNFPEYARKRAKLELALIYIFCSSLRLSEGISLKIEDIEEGYLRVMGKGSKEKLVPIEEPVMQAIQDYRFSRHDNGPYLFPGKEPGSHMARRTAENIIKKLCRRAGLPDVSVHTFRHTAATQLLKLGATLRDIQEVMGHESIETTKLYTHIVREDLARRLPKRFGPHNQGKLD